MQWQVLDYSSNERKLLNLWSGMGDWEYGNVSHDYIKQSCNHPEKHCNDTVGPQSPALVLGSSV